MKTSLALVMLLGLVAPARAGSNTFNVTNSGSTDYVIDGMIDPSLTLTRGQSYTFQVNAAGHPFNIKTVRTTGTTNRYNVGVTGQGVTSGQLTFDVPVDAPNTLFYQCSTHSPMGGTLNIVNPVGVETTLPATVWLGPAIPNPARDETQFQFALPRRAQVDFAVFDQRGRTVRVLVRGEMPAGNHVARWNGRGRAGNLAPSGTYFYRLRVERRSYSGRFVLLR